MSAPAHACRAARVPSLFGWWLVGCLLGLQSSDPAFALDPDKSLQQFNCLTWSRQNGLPANGIDAITQTPEGYLWLGGVSGLIRFDGLGFTLVGMAPDPALRTTQIRSLAPATGGGLWFGIKNGAYGRYDSHGNWRMETNPDGNTDWDVTSLLESKDGRLWLGGEYAGSRSRADSRIEPIFPAGPARPFVLCMLEDSRGRILAGTASHGLYRQEAGRFVKLSLDREGSGPTRTVNVLAQDKEDRLWIGTPEGLICLDAQDQPKDLGSPSGPSRALLVDRQGVLWVGTTGNGLWRFSHGAWSSLKKSDGLADDHVLSLAEDREGSLWIGTREGLNQLTDVKFPTFGAAEGLGADTALSVSTSPRGGLWACTATGARYFDGHRFTEEYGTNAGLANPYVKRLLETRDGEVYLVSGENRIDVLANGRLVASHATTDMPVALAEDSRGVVVSVGADLYRVGRDYLRPYVFTNSVRPALYWIVNMTSCRDGAILVGSANGVCRIKEGGFEQWTQQDGLTDQYARWVTEDDDGTIWAGLATGIARIRGREIRNIRREDGLFDANIFAIVPDSQGGMWVDSNRGIFRVARANLNDFADGKIPRVSCVSYEDSSSVKPGDKYEQEQSACKTLDGRIWFPGSRGIIRIDPANVPANQLPPPVYLTSFRANGREVADADCPGLPPGRGELEFQYTALSYAELQKVRFRYQLQGYDQQWVEAGTRRMAAYNNLRPGQYTFRVLADNADNVWNNAGAAVAFRLLPHFYQTAWFYTLCGLLACAALTAACLSLFRRLRLKEQAARRARENQERHRAETALRESQALYHSLVEQLPVGIFRKDKSGRYVFVNSFFCRIKGRPPDYFLGRTPQDLLREATPDDPGSQGLATLLASAQDHHESIVRSGRKVELEEETSGPDGKPMYFQTLKTPVFGPDGQITGSQGVFFDITGRKQAEAALAEASNLMEQLLENCPDLIYFKDRDSRFLRYSKAFLSRIGVPDTESIKNRTDFDIFDEQHARPAFEDEQEIIRTGRSVIGKTEKEVWQDGHVTWALTSKLPLRDAQGRIIGTFGISKDISALKDAEARLEAMHRQLLETSRQAGMAEVATSVLHNVGNVLNSINVATCVLGEQIKKSRFPFVGRVAALMTEHAEDLGGFMTVDPRGQKLPGYLAELAGQLAREQSAALAELAQLEKNVSHIKDIVAMQQNYARVSGVTEKLQPGEVVEDALRMNAAAFARHGVEVRREFAPNLPDIVIDRHKVLQILVNLVRNAKHACDDSGSKDKRITVRLANGDGRIKISVVDNGVGIPPENLTRIFNHGFTTRKDGHGFGLHSGALAARELGGELSVHSDGPGRGATFLLELPVEHGGASSA